MLTDNDIRAVVATIRTERVVAAHDAIDPFDTPAVAHASPVHEAGYGHGV